MKTAKQLAREIGEARETLQAMMLRGDAHTIAACQRRVEALKVQFAKVNVA